MHDIRMAGRLYWCRRRHAHDVVLAAATIKVIREKETLALSLPGTGAFTAGVLLWLVYGVAIDDWPLIGSNGAILAMKLRHGAVLTPLANVRCVLIAWPCAGATACIWLSPRGSLS